MTTPDATTSKARDALLHESKDRIAINVFEVCRELHIRAMLGGGPVLNANGLLTPHVSTSAAILVDPASFRHLRIALLARGWREIRAPRRFRILPTARLMLAHPDHVGGLTVYPVIPGFFADPEETFDLIWELHRVVPLRGHNVSTLGRLDSAILASHDGLDGKYTRSASNFDYFVAQFSTLLDERERGAAVELIRKMGGCAEMNLLIVALGEEPCEFTLPSIPYAEWRLQIENPPDRLRRMLAFLELGPDGRKFMRASESTRPRSVRDAVVSVLSFPKTAAAIVGSRRRWEQSLS